MSRKFLAMLGGVVNLVIFFLIEFDHHAEFDTCSHTVCMCVCVCACKGSQEIVDTLVPRP